MERNLQIKFRCLFLILAVSAMIAGCKKDETLEQPYDFSRFKETARVNELNGYSDPFAEELCVAYAVDDTDLSLTGDAAGVFQIGGGDAVFERNVFARMNPASTTKIMTSIIALKYAGLNDSVTITDAVNISEPGSTMAGVRPGDVITLEDLLYGLMIPSGNDAANAIAVHVGGSIEAFVEMMNAEAKRLGATGTHFANANGFTDPDHYTTAYDLYLIFNEALKYDKFREIIGAHDHIAQYTAADGSEKTATWGVGNYYMNGKKETPSGLTVFGGKTGTTQAAGYCLIMGTYTEDGREYASVIMKADSRNTLYEDMTKIISKIDK